MCPRCGSSLSLWDITEALIRVTQRSCSSISSMKHISTVALRVNKEYLRAFTSSEWNAFFGLYSHSVSCLSTKSQQTHISWMQWGNQFTIIYILKRWRIFSEFYLRNYISQILFMLIYFLINWLIVAALHSEPLPFRSSVHNIPGTYWAITWNSHSFFYTSRNNELFCKIYLPFHTIVNWTSLRFGLLATFLQFYKQPIDTFWK